MSIRDYSRRLFCNIKWCGLRCNRSCLYSSTDNGLFTRFMPTKYHHLACFRLSFVHVTVCVSVQLMRGSWNFCRGGGGGSRPHCQTTVLTTFFLDLNLFYSFYRECQMVISKKTIIFQGFRVLYKF